MTKDEHNVRVVAEIGINHNGDIDNAKALIHLASMYGADYVKFQKRDVDLVYSKDYLASKRVSPWGTTQREQKEGLELSRKEYEEIDRYCKKKDIGWFASPWDINSIGFLESFDVPYMKIPSALNNDRGYLKAVQATDIPMIMSTGMTESVQELKNNVMFLGDNLEYILHCVSSYPTPEHEMNMNAINALKEMFPQHKIGFSNHAQKIIYCVQSYCMGAEMIEFHVTLNRDMYGSDQAASIGPVGFDRIMKHIRSIQNGWGNGEIGMQSSEKPIAEKLRGC